MKKLFAGSLVVLLFLAGCGSNSPGGNTGQLTGKLSVTISGLPNSVDANVTVSGPKGFGETLTETTIFNNLALGNYTISAQDVTTSGTTYEASVTGSPVNVQAGMTTNAASVSYHKVVSLPPPSKNNHAPTVSLSVVTTSAKRGISATASASDPDGDNLTYTWNFGDGTTQIGSSQQTHSYTASSTYTVTVSASDGKGSTSASEPIKVQYLRPANSPDVEVIGFAGRCGFFGIGCTNPPDQNEAYLSKKPQTLQAIVDAFKSLGYTAEYKSYSAHLWRHFSTKSNQWEDGYLDAESFLESAEQNWISDFDNPTHLVLVGHSHGTVWATLLAVNHPEAQFDYFISLDGICYLWWTDNDDYIKNYYDAHGLPRPYPLVYGTPCNRFQVPGLSEAQDLNDIFFWNSTFGLEVGSDPSVLTNPIWDGDPNHRPDGSTGSGVGIATIVAEGQTHMNIEDRYSNAMNWVVGMIQANGLPVYESHTSTLGIHQMKSIPAPEGYHYYQGR